ncbi:MAG: adenine deaminase [Deltaproteobacteria bacterium]|nr:adenine deaminase [Deltaproteobacteria bacterium]
MEQNIPPARLDLVAMKKVPADLLVTNGVLFNAFTGEFQGGHSLWIKDGWIAYAGPDTEPAVDGHTRIMDVEGMVLLPGLIEGHTHLLNLIGIEEFVRHVIPSGTTTVVTETTELATAVGIDGIKYFVEGIKDQPIRFYYTLSPLCGISQSVEKDVPSNKELFPFLEDPWCLGVGEIYWGNMLLESRQGRRVRELARQALSLGKRVEGHSAGASANKLQAYSSLGISSCHEPITESEVLERIRLGLWVMIRQGAVRNELDGVKGIFQHPIDKRRLILCTDSMDPEGFLSRGYLDAAVREALRLRVSPSLVYQMVTLNVAEHFRLDHLLGSLSPGKRADMVVIPAPEDFSPVTVIREGHVIFQDGRNLVEPRKTVFPEHFFHAVTLPGLPALKTPKTGKVRVIEMVTRLVTKETVVDLDDQWEPGALNMALAIDRTGSGEAFLGFLKGFGLQQGACGSTMCWDTPDMIVLGCDEASMETVIGRLQELGGGAVYALGREVVAEFPAPLCGVISLAPMKVARDQIRHFEETLKQNGVPWENPLLTLNTQGNAAIPHVRLTHQGYVRMKDRKVLPLTV